MLEILTVSADDNGKRLDIFISEETDYSRSRVKTAAERGLITVNGKTAEKAGLRLKTDDSVEIILEEAEELQTAPENIPIKIVYQDACLAVIDKPQGMVTHPATGSPNGTLVNALLYHIKDLSSINGVIRPGIVHRLDKDTSGLIVIAKNDKAHTDLAKQIAEKSAFRTYIALIDGNLKEDEGKIEQPIGRSLKDRKKMAVVKDGRYALTYFKVLERFGAYTLTEFRLATGRTHQIRVHANFIKHPVVGDELYSGSNKFKLAGQLLHSAALEFTHPLSGERMRFTSELPPHFLGVLQILRKNSD